MVIFKPRRHSALVLASALFWGQPALAQTTVQASPQVTEAAAANDDAKPLVSEAKLRFLIERSARKARQSNPARPDKPQEAVNWFVGKRTGPVITRGPNAVGRPAALDTSLYPEALREARLTPFFNSRLGTVVANSGGGLTAGGISAAAGAALGSWESMGPNNQGGRTRQLLIDPSNPSTMYAAAVGGGVWKSTNSGANWAPLTDLLLPNIAVASLAMDPRNPQVLYAGTGEGFFNVDAITGAGIFKTTDGGATWAPLAATTPPPGATASDFSYVNQLVVSSRDSNRIFAATRRGVFRSTDGGSTWTRLIDAASVNGCTDMVLQTRRSVGYVFAACGTFTQATIHRALDSATSVFTPVFTEAGMGRTSLALAPSNENIVYALAANASSSAMHAVFRTTTGGAAGSWTARVRSTDANRLNRLQLTNPVYSYTECVGSAVGNYNQGWYDNVIAVDPTDPDKVWTGGIDLMRSDDGGQSWGIASYWWFNQGQPNYAHADQHVIRFHPGYNGTTNKQMFVANDGGVFRTDDARAAVGKTIANVCGTPVAGMVTWTELNTNYTTTQYYNGTTYPDGNAFLGGMQDNGTWRGTTASKAGQRLLGGDGSYVSLDTKGDAIPANDVLFAGYTGLSLQKSVNGGANFSYAISGIGGDGGFAFIAPHHMNSGNRQVMYTGGWIIWRTTDQAGSWVRASLTTAGLGSVSAISSSPVDANRVLVGMSDGYIHATATGLSNTSATNWPVTQPRTVFVSAIAHHPTNPLVAYATFSTFSGVSVYMTNNGGTSWTPMPGTGANVLPRVPATAVVVDPSDGQRVYVGTDIGVYTTVDGGANWYREVTNFGHVSVEALAINSTGPKYLYAFTHGRGAWRVLINP